MPANAYRLGHLSRSTKRTVPRCTALLALPLMALPVTFAAPAQAEESVDSSDGSIAIFAARRLKTFPKDRFPTELSSTAATNRPTPHLITCGGRYDETGNNYDANVIAFAELVDSRDTWYPMLGAGSARRRVEMHPGGPSPHDAVR